MRDKFSILAIAVVAVGGFWFLQTDPSAGATLNTLFIKTTLMLESMFSF